MEAACRLLFGCAMLWCQSSKSTPVACSHRPCTPSPSRPHQLHAITRLLLLPCRSTVRECYWTGNRQMRWSRAIYAANLGKGQVVVGADTTCLCLRCCCDHDYRCLYHRLECREFNKAPCFCVTTVLLSNSRIRACVCVCLLSALWHRPSSYLILAAPCTLLQVESMSCLCATLAGMGTRAI
jgi:hypothetical protein